MSTLQYFTKNIDKIIEFTIEHIELISVAMFLALVLWISIGILIRENERLAGGIIGTASIIMSIPSISIYGILVAVPGLGLSRKSAIIALVLYAMLPIVRNVYVALNEVDSSIIEAARGMGMPERQVLLKVQLPLAFPVILQVFV